MKKISRERFEWLKERHYELWDWLAKNPDKRKSEWEWFKSSVKSPISCECFACQFTKEISDLNKSMSCEYCPLGADNIGCFNGGLFRKWAKATGWMRSNESSTLAPVNKQDATYLAKQIRDLPWSEEYVEDKVMSENYIVINGNKTELTKEQMEQLGIEIEKNNNPMLSKWFPKRWRAKENGRYFFVSYSNKIQYSIDLYDTADSILYRTHNYFKIYGREFSVTCIRDESLVRKECLFLKSV